MKAKVYKFPNKRSKTNEIPFGSKIKVTDSKSKFYQFSKGWVNKKDVKPISFKDKNPFKKISIFKKILDINGEENLTKGLIALL